jgi:Transposase, Mutator family
MDHGRFHATVRGCWVHKIANVLDKLPKSLQPKAKAALHEMMNAPTKVECEKLVAAFVAEHEAKNPKATKALATESDKLRTYFELPAEHWKHLRTTNPIESTFATVKLRQRVTKGAGSRGAGSTGRSLGIPPLRLLPGTTIARSGDHGMLVLEREMARELGLT